MREAIELTDSVAWVGCPASLPVARSHSLRRDGASCPPNGSAYLESFLRQNIDHLITSVAEVDGRALPRPSTSQERRASRPAIQHSLVSPAADIAYDPPVTFYTLMQSCMEDVEAAVRGNRARPEKDFRMSALRRREAPQPNITEGARCAEPRFDDHHHTDNERWLRKRGALFRDPSNRIAGRGPSGATGATEAR